MSRPNVMFLWNTNNIPTTRPDLSIVENGFPSGAIYRASDHVWAFSLLSKWLVHLDGDNENNKKSITNINKALTGKEPVIQKKNGFNLAKSDSVNLDDSNVLATSKAIKTLKDSLDSVSTTASDAKQIAEGKITNNGGVGYDTGANIKSKIEAAANSATSAHTAATNAQNSANAKAAKDGSTDFPHLILGGWTITVV